MSHVSKITDKLLEISNNNYGFALGRFEGIIHKFLIEKLGQEEVDKFIESVLKSNDVEN